MSKLRIGIIFGGRSKEREISFAGGRTVYDNLNKSIFEAVPLFVDSFGNFVLLDWQFVYKGTIRDFYPPVEFLPANNKHFQYYAENLGDLSVKEQDKLIHKIGKKIEPNQLHNLIDFAFLCLHGPYGEDGRVQGFFEYLNIPYSGSGILPSAIGIDKSVQKKLMVQSGFNSPPFFSVDRNEWMNKRSKDAWQNAKEKIGFPIVIKPANQGSSIGVTILHDNDEQKFNAAIEKAFFIGKIKANEWNILNEEDKIKLIHTITDIREGIGMPIKIGEKIIYDPNNLLAFFNRELKTKSDLTLESLDGESTVLIEGFIEGKEFSCIVIEDESGKAIALPPTEIRKGKELFDYRSKYMPGLARKITPIDLPDSQINAIRKDCEKLFYTLNFDVYARIDGFLGIDGKIFLNDPNTTSGMMPSSFFFHQAAEIGLNPSQFLTFIIRTSLAKRIKNAKGANTYNHLLQQLDTNIHNEKHASRKKIKVAVILGGYSSERHISVESGRNIYEKLASSEKYLPVPVFLTGNNEKHLMYKIPINLLLKDNADDIKEKILSYKIHLIIHQIIKECHTVTDKYASTQNLEAPQLFTYADLGKNFDAVFIALHGRPGEDGSVQEQLEKVNLYYNGSDKATSEITIDKFRTNEILKQNGFLVAEHRLVTQNDWQNNKPEILNYLLQKVKYPFIAKPVDDGCSSAVKKIKTPQEFEAFATLMFRSNEELDSKAAEILHIKLKEEFPQKSVILVEELISKNKAKHFLEITGGMLTKFKNKKLEYEVFEASEALAEGDILSLEEKFLAGQGQNITPARYAKDKKVRQKISNQVKQILGKAAKVLNILGYCRIDAFVRIFANGKIEVIFIEVNSLPGMTPATCIYHQAAINHYHPYEFIDKILEFGDRRKFNMKRK